MAVLHGRNDLTQHERLALGDRYDLAAAHLLVPLSNGQKGIVDRLPQIWESAQAAGQGQSEDRFLHEFLHSQNQLAALLGPRPLLTYSASVAMTMVTNLLRRRATSVAVIEPCFDNLRNLMRHVDLEVVPLPEDWLYSSHGVHGFLRRNVHTGALFIVDPNNPTGRSWICSGHEVFSQIVRFARDTGKTLVFDFSFAPFAMADARVGRFDVYEILRAEKCSFIAIEDTGKQWPHMDMKAAVLLTSPDLHAEMYNIYTTYLLNVSPFILQVLAEFALESRMDGFNSLAGLLDENRRVVQSTFEGSVLEHVAPDVEVSVAWFKIRSAKWSGSTLSERILRDANVHVLPGSYFYWNQPALGESFIRLSLGRETDMLREAVVRMRHVLDEL